MTSVDYLSLDELLHKNQDKAALELILILVTFRVIYSYSFSFSVEMQVQVTFTYSKSTIETLDEGVKYVQS